MYWVKNIEPDLILKCQDSTPSNEKNYRQNSKINMLFSGGCKMFNLFWLWSKVKCSGKIYFSSTQFFFQTWFNSGFSTKELSCQFIKFEATLVKCCPAVCSFVFFLENFYILAFKNKYYQREHKYRCIKLIGHARKRARW